MIKVFLKNKIAPRIELGHPWVFGNEIDRIDGSITPGGIVQIYNAGKKFIGQGFINPKSQIAARILSRKKDETIDDSFFFKKILEAWNYRKRLGYHENCRLVFGEADGLPALIIDKFHNYFVIQTLALGIDIWKPAIVEALNSIFHPAGIYERNDVPVRELEGLPLVKGFLSAPFHTKITIRENGLQFWVDLENGQKTGYFLDQHDNRRAIKHIVKDSVVLGAFSYTGSFEIHAGHYEASSVLGLDISESAVALANENAALNGLSDKVQFQVANAFDVLKQWSKQKMEFDVVMLDPPAFTKSRTQVAQALSGYKEINLRGIKLLRNGGFLVTSSCTNLVSPSQFLATVNAAARDAKRSLRQVSFQTQSSDHPILPGIENTHYLKFLIAQVYS